MYKSVEITKRAYVIIDLTLLTNQAVELRVGRWKIWLKLFTATTEKLIVSYDMAIFFYIYWNINVDSGCNHSD